MDTPHLVDSLKGKRVVDVACGSSHSACVLEDGSLYTWGKGRYGRLGHGDHEPQHKPKQVRGSLFACRFIGVVCLSVSVICLFVLRLYYSTCCLQQVLSVCTRCCVFVLVLGIICLY